MTPSRPRSSCCMIQKHPPARTAVSVLSPMAGRSAALAAERAAVPGRAVRAVNLPGVLAPGRADGARFPGTLALQRLEESGLHLICGGGLVRPAWTVAGLCLVSGACSIRGSWLLPMARHVAGTFRPCRLAGHGGLLPRDGHLRSCAGPAARPS